LTIRLLEDLHAHQLIMSVGGITSKGLFNSNLLLVETERQMMRCCDEVIVVADHSKLGRPALAFLCQLGDIDTLIVDAKATLQQREMVEQAGVRLILGGQEEESNHE
jgi:DeoR/GlpR family transcriptional regulator of sugar metabolism